MGARQQSSRRWPETIRPRTRALCSRLTGKNGKQVEILLDAICAQGCQTSTAREAALRSAILERLGFVAQSMDKRQLGQCTRHGHQQWTEKRSRWIWTSFTSLTTMQHQGELNFTVDQRRRRCRIAARRRWRRIDLCMEVDREHRQFLWALLCGLIQHR